MVYHPRGFSSVLCICSVYQTPFHINHTCELPIKQIQTISVITSAQLQQLKQYITINSRLRCYGDVECKDAANWIIHNIQMETEGTQQRKTWWDCVKGDMEVSACPLRMLSIGITGG